MDIQYLEKLVNTKSASYSDIVEFVSDSGKVLWKGSLSEAIELAPNYNIKRFVEPVSTFNKASMAIQVESLYEEVKGVQKEVKQVQKYDLSDKSKVLNAIKFFNYTKDNEEEYAHEIINCMHKYGIGTDVIGSDNRLCKYIDSCTADLPSEEKKSESKEEKEESSEDEESDEEQLKESIYCELFDDSDDSLFEELNHSERRTWRMVKNTMKFVDKESARKALPQLEGKSDREVVKQLKAMLERLPEEKKLELIKNHSTAALEAKALGIGKGHRVAGNIVAGVGGTGTAAAGIVGTVHSTGAAVSAIAGAAAASGYVPGAIIGGIAASILIGGIVAVGGLALTAIVTGGTVAIAKGISKANEHRVQNKHIAMLSQREIIKELKKYGTVKEDGKEVIPQRSMKLALAEGKKTYYHTCEYCGANLDPNETCDCPKSRAARGLEPAKDDNKDEEPKKCSKCGRELNDAGECPLCDLGDESVLDEGNLLEVPLYVSGEGTDEHPNNEIKTLHGKSIDTEEEVAELRKNHTVVKDKNGIGVFNHANNYVGGDEKEHDVTLIKKDGTSRQYSRNPHSGYDKNGNLKK